jgi:transcriptional regulator with XRE-family HTH domain
MFYDVYCALCARDGLTPSGAAAKIGFNRASVTVWKTKGTAPKQELLVKIADFFRVSTDYLLGIETENAPTGLGGREVSDAELKFALWGDCEDISDADLADVRRYAAFVRERKKELP